MADTIQKYMKHLEDALQDTSEQLQPDDKARALSQAVLLYSKDKPYKIVKSVTGDGTSYDFDLPSDWVHGFSFIDGAIEYPAGDYQIPQYITDDEWVYYKKIVSGKTVTVLRILTFIPATGKTLQYVYSIPHTCDKNSCTIFEIDFEAVISLTAAICFWALAAKFAQSSDASIDADAIDYQRQSELYSELARNKMDGYNRIMSRGEFAKDSSAASVGVSVKDLDMRMSYGEDFLTHPSSIH